MGPKPLLRPETTAVVLPCGIQRFLSVLTADRCRFCAIKYLLNLPQEGKQAHCRWCGRLGCTRGCGRACVGGRVCQCRVTDQCVPVNRARSWLEPRALQARPRYCRQGSRRPSSPSREPSRLHRSSRTFRCRRESSGDGGTERKAMEPCCGFGRRAFRVLGRFCAGIWVILLALSTSSSSWENLSRPSSMTETWTQRAFQLLHLNTRESKTLFGSV